MSGDGPHEDRRVRFTTKSLDRLDKWGEHASDEDWALVSEALMRVVDGTWRSRFEHYQAVTHPFTWHILVRSGLIMTVKFAQEYPDYVQLIYVGPL